MTHHNALKRRAFRAASETVPLADLSATLKAKF